MIFQNSFVTGKHDSGLETLNSMDVTNKDLNVSEKLLHKSFMENACPIHFAGLNYLDLLQKKLLQVSTKNKRKQKKQKKQQQLRYIPLIWEICIIVTANLVNRELVHL